MGETLESLSLLDRLLRCELAEAHEHIAHILWDAESDAVAVSQLESLADTNVRGWEDELKGRDYCGSDRGERDDFAG